MKLNHSIQYYQNLPLQCIGRFKHWDAMKFFINGNTKCSVWIPKAYLESDGTLKKSIY